MSQCIISPILHVFTLFLNDLQESISIGSHGIDLETTKLFVLLFDDDLVIFSETVIELQRLINKLAEYCVAPYYKSSQNKNHCVWKRRTATRI